MQNKVKKVTILARPHCHHNKILICILTSVISTLLLVGCIESTQQKNENSTNYRVDIQPLVERFGHDLNIEKCYWKADVIGKTKIGPSSYWMKGFIVLEKKSVERLTSKYTFTKTEILFNTEELDPFITGFSNFNWCYSKDMSNDFKEAKFIGEVYFDEINGIIYFDLESR